MLEWLRELLRPVIYQTDTATYVQRTPTIWDIALMKSPRYGRTSIVLPAVNNAYTSGNIKPSGDCVMIITDASFDNISNRYGFYEISDGTYTVRSYPVAPNANNVISTFIYGAVSNGIPLVVMPGEVFRFGIVNTGGAAGTCTINYRYFEVNT